MSESKSDSSGSKTAPIDPPAPEWLRSFGWLAAVVIGHGMLLNGMVIVHRVPDEPLFASLHAGLIGGQLTALFILAFCTPQAFSWKLAGAVLATSIIKMIAEGTRPSYSPDPIALVIQHVITVASLITISLTAWRCSLAMRNGRVQGPILGQLSLLDLLGWTASFAAICGLLMHTAFSHWQPFQGTGAWAFLGWSLWSGLMGGGLFFAICGFRRRVSWIGFAVATFILCSTLHVVALSLLRPLSGDYLGDWISHACWQHASQTLVVLLTFFGLSEAGLVLQGPHQDGDALPSQNEPNSADKSA